MSDLLPPFEWRCRPDAHGCSARSRCARAQATVAPGDPLRDPTATEQYEHSVRCDGYIDAMSRRKQANPPPPRVHPSVRGL